MKKLLVGLLALTTLTSSANASYYVSAGGGASYYSYNFLILSFAKSDFTASGYVGASMDLSENVRVGAEMKGVFPGDNIKTPFATLATFGYYFENGFFSNIKVGYNFSSFPDKKLGVEVDSSVDIDVKQDLIKQQFELASFAYGLEFGFSHEINENLSLIGKIDYFSSRINPITKDEGANKVLSMLSVDNNSLSLGLTYKF